MTLTTCPSTTRTVTKDTPSRGEPSDVAHHHTTIAHFTFGVTGRFPERRSGSHFSCGELSRNHDHRCPWRAGTPHARATRARSDILESIVATPEDRPELDLDADLTPLDAALTREARRLYERYAVEVVERFELCPWAARARREGSVRTLVLHQRNTSDLTPSLRAIEALAAVPSVAIALLIHPRLEVDRLDFEHFLRHLRHADSQRHDIGKTPFAMAAFHPAAAADLRDPDRLVPFIRRTPDPTLQLVRREVLESVHAHTEHGTAFADLWMVSPGGLTRETGPSVRERIAQRNLQTIQRVGVATLEAVFGDIARDRARTYARILSATSNGVSEDPGR